MITPDKSLGTILPFPGRRHGCCDHPLSLVRAGYSVLPQRILAVAGPVLDLSMTTVLADGK